MNISAQNHAFKNSILSSESEISAVRQVSAAGAARERSRRRPGAPRARTRCGHVCCAHANTKLAVGGQCGGRRGRATLGHASTRIIIILSQLKSELCQSSNQRCANHHIIAQIRAVPIIISQLKSELCQSSNHSSNRSPSHAFHILGCGRGERVKILLLYC